MKKFNPKEYIIGNKLQNTYSYLLGLYLGDGYIVKMDRTYRLRIYNTVQYDNLNKYIICELQKMFMKNKVNYVNFKTYLSIYVYSNNLPIFFPQHGSGKKQDREIVLFDWQKEIISYKHLFAGLLHSDGSIYFERTYKMCDFTNKSEGILSIFKLCSLKLNLNYTVTKDRIHIRNRPNMKWIDENIGDKENIKISSSDGMVDLLVSKTSVERRAGSSPALRTN
jgi:hypothetical protein